MTRAAKALIAFTFAIVAAALIAPFGALGEVVQDLAVADGPYEGGDNSGVIVIKVPAEDLDRCIATLDAVFMAPVQDAQVQTASLSPAQAGQTVRCEAEG
ncbi:hypothetical protein [Celeribacter ethanolicus]|uniref:Uncharacterized protein n=1 Tax=Celeribacter ethanolicus TaxID=1758178 RepID=A0A291GHP5_9RHOB|nr:hypothetical protein [Celeribacter ethanolicus]ATG49562.1 hypothetical protein CEW89_19490 [Celeribacter ethanolicus]